MVLVVWSWSGPGLGLVGARAGVGFDWVSPNLVNFVLEFGGLVLDFGGLVLEFGGLVLEFGGLVLEFGAPLP